MKRFVALALVVLSAASWGQQIHRCQDPKTGKTTLTDAACTPAERDQVVGTKASAGEVAAHEEEASWARQRFLDQQASEAPARAQIYQQAPPRSTSAPIDRSNSYECQVAMRNISDPNHNVSRSSNVAEVAKAQAACGTDLSRYVRTGGGDWGHQRTLGPARVVPPPSTITSCDSGGCWDDRGNRYDGSGTTFTRSDGRFCTATGGLMQCN